MGKRIVFMGTPEFAVASLDAIYRAGYTLAGIVTAPDKPAGRGQKLALSAVKTFALQHNLPLLQPVKLKDPDFLAQLAQWQADLQVVVAFRMLPKEVIDMPPYGTFNLHASLLPHYRGAAPINWAIINGETQSGVTTFFLNEEIDHGDIIHQTTQPISPEDTAGSLHDKLMEIGKQLVIQTIDDIFSGKATRKPQANFAPSLDNTTAMPPLFRLAPKIFKPDCRIAWQQQPESILHHIRGLSPYPAAFTTIEHPDHHKTISLKIFLAHLEHAPSVRFAPELQSDGKTFLRIAVSQAYLYFDSLQIEGKKRLPVTEFLRGNDLRQWRVC